MARQQSAILTVVQKSAVLRDVRTELREAKAVAFGAKRMLTQAQKTFLAYPTDGEAVKAYRAAVSDHIRCVKAAMKIAKKLPS